MGDEVKPMHYNVSNGITHIEYYEIKRDPTDPDNGIFSRFGRQIRTGPIDASKESVAGAMHHPFSKLPSPNGNPPFSSSDFGADSSGLSIKNKGEKILYVFKVHDDLGWHFAPDKHPFGIHPHDEEDVEVLNKLFSDCRLFIKKGLNKIDVIEPQEADRRGDIDNRPGKKFPLTQWAGFFYNGVEARKYPDVRKSFTLFLVDQNDEPVTALHFHEGEETSIKHPPAWPSHHNDID